MEMAGLNKKIVMISMREFTWCPNFAMVSIQTVMVESTSRFSRCTAWYRDADRDGFGLTVDTLPACSNPGPEWVLVDGDCDDTNADVWKKRFVWPRYDDGVIDPADSGGGSMCTSIWTVMGLGPTCSRTLVHRSGRVLGGKWNGL